MPASATIACRACGAVSDWAERVPFSAECPTCRAELHSCRNCRSYSPGRNNDCDEPSAERVVDKERRNRCEWFRAKPAGGAAGKKSDPAAAARAAAEALFRKK